MGYKTVLKTTKTRKPHKTSHYSGGNAGITALIKKVVHKEAETKSLITWDEYALFNDYIYATNLNYKLQQGTGDDKIIGERFFLKNIHLKGHVVNNNGTSNGNLVVRLAIIKTKTQLTNTTVAIGGTQVFRAGTVDFAASMGMVDFNKVDLVKDISFTIPQPSISNISNTRPFDINLKVERNLAMDFAAGYLKDKNYYMVVTVHKADYVAANAGYLRCQYTLNFKDI